MNKKVNVDEFIKKYNLKPAFVVAPDKTEKFLEEMANPTITAEDVIKRTEEKLKMLKERARRREMTKEKILEKLASIDKEKFGILELGLFGSYAKGTDKFGSDLDIMVKFERSSKEKHLKSMLFRMYDLEELLKSMFPNTKIDLIEKGTFDYQFHHPEVRKYKEQLKKEILESVIYV